MASINILFCLGGAIKRTVTKFDLFSQKIMFTYKGQSSFSTFFGGLVSLWIFIFIGIYATFLTQTMIYRQNSNNSLSTEVVDLITNDQDYYPVEGQSIYY